MNLTTAAGCAWSVANTNSWITILSPTNNTGAGAVTYALEANLTILGRTGLVMIADQVFTLVQLGAPCTYDLSPRNRSHGPGVASSGVLLTTLAGCAWDVVNTNSWITINSPTNGTDSTTVIYSLDPNPTVFDRANRLGE